MVDEHAERRGEERRAFLGGVGLVAMAAIAGRSVPTEAEAPAAPAPADGGGIAAALGKVGQTPQGPRGEELFRMREDLKRALQKPVEQRKWVMVINTKKCSGCFACVVACMTENVAGPGVSYRAVPEVEMGEFPHVSRTFMPTNCMQCDRPPCVNAANAVSPGAMAKRPDGIVTINYEKFRDRKAFEAAQKACPCTALYFDDGTFFSDGTRARQPYETAASFEYGDMWTRADGKAPGGSARKCHFCLHRLNAGLLPACVTTCDGGVTYFGDLNDPKSLAAELLRAHASLRLKAGTGTQPRMFYLVDDSQAAENLKACLACHQS